ncbi:MAG: efflux RND transporter periplasmic adaptor subunit [Ignavibacteriae bacterium]|nr:efflux RND transporter periplasmic adaptor subunit [Ignavibacteriota bacterium]
MSLITEKADLSGLRINHDEPTGGSGKTKRKLLIAAIVVVALAIGFFLLRGTFASVPEVEVGSVTLTYPSSANAVLTASGYIVAQQEAAIASKATGRLVSLSVEEGDKVKKNQVIGQIEDHDVVAALAQAKANLELAKADLDDARQWRDRQRIMLPSGLTSQAEVDAAEARFKRVEATIKAAEASVQAANVALENTRIRAPFDGTVLSKNANIGEVVAPFAAGAGSKAAVVTIADMNSLEVEADVSESNITRVILNAPCEITLDAYPETRYQGFVHKVVPTADRSKATVMTKVRFKERDEHVLPEMSAKVTFLSKEVAASEAKAPPKLTIPAAALSTRDGKHFVLLVQDETVTEKEISAGEAFGDRIAVTGGLAKGDRVVLRPDPSLTTGSKIKIK